MFFSVLLVAFDATHCTKKCYDLFSDSPTKLNACKQTCDFDPKKLNPNNQQERPKIMSKSVLQCINVCNANLNSSTNFLTWSKCRKDCLKKPGTNEFQYYEEATCVNHCDRYWKGTVHWKPCLGQCSGYSKSNERKQKKQSNENNNVNPRQGAFNMW